MSYSSLDDLGGVGSLYPMSVILRLVRDVEKGIDPAKVKLINLDTLPGPQEIVTEGPGLIICGSGGGGGLGNTVTTANPPRAGASFGIANPGGSNFIEIQGGRPALETRAGIYQYRQRHTTIYWRNTASLLMVWISECLFSLKGFGSKGGLGTNSETHGQDGDMLLAYVVRATSFRLIKGSNTQGTGGNGGGDGDKPFYLFLQVGEGNLF